MGTRRRTAHMGGSRIDASFSLQVLRSVQFGNFLLDNNSPENRPDSLKGKSDEWIMAELARLKNTMHETKNPRKR